MSVESERKNEHHPGIMRKRFMEGKFALVTPDDWLAEKRKKDGAEGLWRIHDKLYDLGDWLEKHPGGRHWLEITKGTDITEAFECHHVRLEAEKYVAKFYVRPAKTERNSLITFHENGFYKTLKRKIISLKVLDSHMRGPQAKSKILADTLALGMFLTAFLAVSWTPWLVLVSGALLGLLAICAHNFFHMADNWRTYYFHLSLMSLRDWRVSHVLSHHLYPNTGWDLEVIMFQPVLNFLPTQDKFGRVSLMLSPIVMASLAHVQFFRRICGLLGSKNKSLKEEMVGLSLLFFLLAAIGGEQPLKAFLFWTGIVAVGSLTFAFLGLTAAHHHPEIYHEGDFLGENKDFGIVQLAAVRNRKEVDSSFFLSLVSFGNHALHHLFPTLDHSQLPRLNAVFQETCKQFKIDFEPFKAKSLIWGMWGQLARRYTNSILYILVRREKEHAVKILQK